MEWTKDKKSEYRLNVEKEAPHLLETALIQMEQEMMKKPYVSDFWEEKNEAI